MRKPEYRQNVATGRVKLTEQVYDPTCLLTFIIVYIAYIAWPLHTHTTHTLDTFGHLHINSCYSEHGPSRIMSYSYTFHKCQYFY